MTTQVSGDTGVSQCQPNSVSQDDLQSNVVGKGPAFSAWTNAAVSLPDTTQTKILFQQKEYDTNSNYSTSTSRFQPTVAGYYLINACVGLNGATAPAVNSVFGLIIYWTGSVFKKGLEGPNRSASVSAVMYMNGTTDYVEIFGLHNYGAGKTTSSTQDSSYFQGTLVRAA